MYNKQKGTIGEYYLLSRLQRALTAQLFLEDSCAPHKTVGSIQCKQRNVERKRIPIAMPAF